MAADRPSNVIPIDRARSRGGPGSHFRFVVGRWAGKDFVDPAADKRAKVHDPAWCSGSPCTCAYGIPTRWHPGDAWFILRMADETAHEQRRGHGPQWPTMYRPRDFVASRRVAIECAQQDGAAPDRLFRILDLLEDHADLWIGAVLGPPA